MFDKLEVQHKALLFQGALDMSKACMLAEGDYQGYS